MKGWRIGGTAATVGCFKRFWDIYLEEECWKNEDIKQNSIQAINVVFRGLYLNQEVSKSNPTRSS